MAKIILYRMGYPYLNKICIKSSLLKIINSIEIVLFIIWYSLARARKRTKRTRRTGRTGKLGELGELG